MNVTGFTGDVSDLHPPSVWNIDVFSMAASRLQVFLRPLDPWPSHCFCWSCLSLCPSPPSLSLLILSSLFPPPLTCNSSPCLSLPTYCPFSSPTSPLPFHLPTPFSRFFYPLSSLPYPSHSSALEKLLFLLVFPNISLKFIMVKTWGYFLSCLISF